LSALLALHGCAVSEVADDACTPRSVGAPITQECFAEELVEATCASVAGDPSMVYGVLAVLREPEACRASVAADQASLARDLAPVGPFAFDPVAAERCLNRLRRGYYPSNDISLSPCLAVYSAPSAVAGSPCVRFECAADARCEVTDECPGGRCVALSPPGTVCNGGWECASDGEAAGLCWFGEGEDPSRCVQSEVQDIALGDTCAPPSSEPRVLRLCAAGLACVDGACAPFERITYDDDCSVDGWCGAGTYCAASRRCEAPVVLPRGAACVAATLRSASAFCDIAAGLVCDLVSSTCEPLGDGSAGARCGGGWSIATNACRARLECVSGRCATPLECR